MMSENSVPTDGEIKNMAVRKPPGSGDVPEPHPSRETNTRLLGQARLILACCGFLTKLAEHGDHVRTQIEGELVSELIHSGSVSASYCAAVYERTRPKGLAKFPPIGTR